MSRWLLNTTAIAITISTTRGVITHPQHEREKKESISNASFNLGTAPTPLVLFSFPCPTLLLRTRRRGTRLRKCPLAHPPSAIRRLHSSATNLPRGVKKGKGGVPTRCPFPSCDLPTGCSRCYTWYGVHTRISSPWSMLNCRDSTSVHHLAKGQMVRPSRHRPALFPLYPSDSGNNSCCNNTHLAREGCPAPSTGVNSITHTRLR